MNRLLNLLKNKYFLVSIVFIVWMLFLDRNDLLSQYDYHQQVKKLEDEKEFYTKEIDKVKTDLDELTTNPDKLEKFAREKYLMKKDNEDVYVIVKDSTEESSYSIF